MELKMFSDFQLYESSNYEIFLVPHCLGMTGSKKAAAGNLAAAVGSSAFQKTKKRDCTLMALAQQLSYNIL